MKKKTRNILTLITGIVGVLTIISLIFSITNGIPKTINTIKSVLPQSSSVPVSISVDPSFIAQGEYYNPTYIQDSYIKLKVNITIKDNNLSYLEIDNPTVDRENKNSQTEVANSLMVDNSQGNYNNNYLVYCSSMYGNSCNYLSNSETISFNWFACQRCFMDTNSPYVITFLVRYQKEGGSMQTIPINVKVPIK